jgi:hypothetical protein
MITTYEINETTKLGITRDVIDLWVKESSEKKISEEKKAEALSSFLLGECVLVVGKL